ncbi:MAG TPA: UDP-3-O-(3-hydroxymyristoyl)glucosamine N-acyltransferase [Armatimonadota bacterium]|jgi:UDP-3-O-[3-hydroxymyristoyl] glucosamine N-acyltransferase
MEITLAQLAVQLDGVLLGNDADAVVTGVAGYDTVSAGEVTFVGQARHLAEAEASPALAIIVSQEVTSSVKPVIRVVDPRAGFARALQLFDWRRTPMPGIDPTAHIANSAAIHARAHIGPFASIGEGAVVGDGCIIHAHAVISDHVEIGAETVIHPQVIIYPRCTIGKRVILHGGVVIGADGFGYQPGPDGLVKIPHLGSVVIEDDVEIGANSNVDRATTGQTVIGRGTKIDNLVHIAHNVQIGPHCLIVAQVGIAGSAVLEAGVIVAPQAGVKDHLHIGAGARVAARAGVTRDVHAGATVSGYPAQSHADQLKLEASLRRVPALMATIKQLERQVSALQARIAEE